MAKVIHKTNREIWVFASKQMGGWKALMNMVKDDNEPLEEIVKLTTEEARGALPEGARVEDIKVETSNLNGPIVNVVIKAVID
ncbi:hypothetical protein [Persephonella sp.]